MKNLICFFCGVFPLCLSAEPFAPADLVVSFDEVAISRGVLAFEEGRNDPRPRLSEFEVEYRRFLSDDLGHRFALVTLSARKSMLRTIGERDIVGVLANGKRIFPIRLEGDTQIGSRGSLFLHFGEQQFPLVDLETRTE